MKACVGVMRRHCFGLCLVLVAASGCNSSTVTLGQAPHDAGPLASDAAVPPLARDADIADAATFTAPSFGAAIAVAGLESDAKDDNPTLTANLLEIYFSSTRGGNADVWRASRTEQAAAFGEPEPVAVLNTDDFDSSPAIDADGLTLWVGSRRESGLGGLDVWVSRRTELSVAFADPSLVAELSSIEDDIPRPLGAQGLAMPLGSRRGGDGVYLTYLAERPSLSAPFAEPRLLSELVVEGANTIDGFLSLDGRQLLFVRAMDERGDLFIAAREGDRFGEALALASVNTDADERDPWLSPDGETLFFSSDREGSLRIYQASRQH
jgi:WD40-like Beta Propeller Repeat